MAPTTPHTSFPPINMCFQQVTSSVHELVISQGNMKSNSFHVHEMYCRLKKVKKLWIWKKNYVWFHSVTNLNLHHKRKDMLVRNLSTVLNNACNWDHIRKRQVLPSLIIKRPKARWTSEYFFFCKVNNLFTFIRRYKFSLTYSEIPWNHTNQLV